MHRGQVCFALSMVLSMSSAAEVTAASAAGFVSEHQLQTAASPARTYQALTSDIHRWWDPDHSYSGRAENFYLEARANGCFCEKLDGGGSVLHMQVAYAEPGRQLRLLGGLGPLQEMGVSGSMSFILDAAGTGTLLSYRYVVHGYLPESPDGLGGLAEVVDSVQLGQLQRLMAYLAENRQAGQSFEFEPQ